MVQYNYISAQERDDAGTSGVMMGGGNNYITGLFQLLPGIYFDWKLSWLSRVPTHFWQVIMASDCGHGFNKLGIYLVFGECVVLL